MTHSNSVSVFTISTFHIVAFIFLLAFNIFIFLRANKNQLLYSFLVVQGSFLIWIVAKIFKTVSPTYELRWFFVVFQYFGICLLEISFLQFAHYYYKGKSIYIKILIPLTLLAVCQFIFIGTNEYHHKFYSEFTFWGDEFAKGFYFHVVILYSYILAGIIMISRKFSREFYHNRQFYEISIAIFIPLLANIYYLSGYYHILMTKLHMSPFDITPIAFEISLGIFAYAIYKKDFLNLKPIFDDEIIKHSSTGIIILDNYQCPIEVNKRGELYLPLLLKVGFIDRLETIDEVISDCGTSEEASSCHVVKKEIRDKHGRQLGYLTTVKDITIYARLKDELEQQMEELQIINEELEEKIDLNDTLSKISARNFVARELHDILGHSMTLAIKLLEIALIECKMLLKEDQELKVIHLHNELIHTQLEEAYRTCLKGYTDLRKSLLEKQEMSYDLIGLKTEVNKMGQLLQVAGVNFNLSMTKVNGLLSDSEYHTIKRFCQEGITNAIKHGKPSEISINMNFSHRLNTITIKDNGMGCEILNKGNGLLGMEDRVKEIDGFVRYNCENGKGFEVSLLYE